MDMNGLFRKYHIRLIWEGILKSAVYGFIAGFAVNFVIAFVTWFTVFNGFWLAIGAGLGVAAVTATALYFFVFRPTTKQIAERIDALGLEERMITMNELKNSTSYIAMRQREDATAKLGAVTSKQIKFCVSVASVVAVAVLAVFGIGMTTVTELSAKGVVPPGHEVVDPILPDKFYEVNYETFDEQNEIVGLGGMIEYGDPMQVVEEGKDAEPVMAVAEDGWTFLGWFYEDGEPASDSENPARQDKNIREDMTLYAHFARVEPAEDDEDGSGEGDGDEAEDQPQEGDSSGDNNEDQQPGSSAGGKYEEGNYIKDGNTYYKEDWDKYYEEMLKRLAEDGNLTDEMRQIIEDYFKIIE